MAQKTFNNVKLNVTFTKATDHLSNIESGNLATSLGKIAKWYDDFHSVVWTGDAATVNGKTVEANVPADAKFTDTTYNSFAGAAAGLVPVSTTDTQALFLRGDGTWASPEVPEYSAAGADLGLVKTGGDVTITNGVIEVNDDSHNHIIDNVDGLQAALDAKVPTTRTVNGLALSADITLDAAAVGADVAGSAAQALADANEYTDGKINDLIGPNGTATLDTITEIADYLEAHEEVVTALNEAIGNKADKTTVTELSEDLSDHIADKNNPHGVTATQIGLGNVENKSAADILGQLAEGTNITITQSGDTFTIAATDTTYENASGTAAGLMSAAHYTKLEGIKAGAEVNQNAFSNIVVGSTTVAADAKEDTVTFKAGENVTLSATGSEITIAATDTTYSNASGTTAGLMSAADYAKLAGIDEGANKYILPAATTGTLGGIIAGSGLTVAADGTLDVVPVSAMTGATASTAGTSGLVPVPAAGANKSFLMGDGTWSTKPVVEEDTLILNCVAD